MRGPVCGCRPRVRSPSPRRLASAPRRAVPAQPRGTAAHRFGTTSWCHQYPRAGAHARPAPVLSERARTSFGLQPTGASLGRRRDPVLPGVRTRPRDIPGRARGHPRLPGMRLGLLPRLLEPGFRRVPRLRPVQPADRGAAPDRHRARGDRARADKAGRRGARETGWRGTRPGELDTHAGPPPTGAPTHACRRGRRKWRRGAGVPDHGTPRPARERAPGTLVPAGASLPRWRGGERHRRRRCLVRDGRGDLAAGAGGGR